MGIARTFHHGPYTSGKCKAVYHFRTDIQRRGDPSLEFVNHNYFDYLIVENSVEEII